MNKALIVVGTGLFMLVTAPPVPASPLMPVGPLAAAATTDEAVSQVRWRHCYRWHCRHYGWYPRPPLRLVQTSPPLLALNI